MKTLFDIGSDKEISNEHTLLLEAGSDFFSYAAWHKASNRVDRLKFTTINETELEEHLPAMIEPLRATSFQAVVFCSAFTQALLVPNKFFNDNYSYLDVIYDQPAQEYFHDRIPEWQMVNLYSIPKSLQQTVSTNFPSVQYYHAYSPTIKIFNGYVADNQLSLHFTSQYFRVLLKKDMAIHLAQTYYYKTSLDVIYYLLKICYEFHLSQHDVYLILSGLVEKDSNLLTDLEQYFTHVYFAQPPEIVLPQTSYPHYFFTSIYNLASCVS